MKDDNKSSAPMKADHLLNSRAVVALTGASYLCVGLSFSYLDRRYGYFGVEGTLWLIWTLLGFSAGILHIGQPVGAGQSQWKVLGCLGFALALFPGLGMFNLLRWVALTLMIILGARAAILKTRRDFYFALTVIFVVSFMVGTHGNADWTLWFYLGPAWALGGLALAWEHAAYTRISRWTKMFMTFGFIFTALLLALVLFFFAPRPPVLGFGFLPPGTDTPGLFSTPAGDNTGTDGKSNAGPSGSAAGTGSGGSGATQPGALAQRWGQMLKRMRGSITDKFIPQWQRNLMDKLLNWAQSLLGALTGQSVSSAATAQENQSSEPSDHWLFRLNWWLLLGLLLLGFLLWRRRYRIGLTIALGGSWALASYRPDRSMHLSALALKWCLHIHGHRRGAGQTVREHWTGAVDVAPLAKRWLGYAVDVYCEMRFGGVPATRQKALNMREAVQGACEVMMGVAPELARKDGSG